MEIHELNTKGITDPAYIALDDGSDTYKLDLNAWIESVESDIETIAESKTKVWYGKTTTGPYYPVKTIDVDGFNPNNNDLLLVRFANGNIEGYTFQIGSYSGNTVYKGQTASIPSEASELHLFQIVTTPYMIFNYIGRIYYDATTSKAGLMSAADKTKLDGIEAEANKTIVDSELSFSSENPLQNKVVAENVAQLTTNFINHEMDSTIHVTSEDKTKWNHMEGNLNNVIGDIAPQYDSESGTYNVGDRVMVNSTLYKCITPITEPELWHTDKWRRDTTIGAVDDLKDDLNNLGLSVVDGALCVTFEES
jgi:hypothetical protein